MPIAPRDRRHISQPRVVANWNGSVVANETTLHQLSPYIGKLKSSMAASLIAQFTKEGDIVYDPFSGSGTVALEAWIANRVPIANDLNPYALLLTRGKLYPHLSAELALQEIQRLSGQAQQLSAEVDLRRVPQWVRAFFYNDTLREIIGWVDVLRKQRQHFLLACLLGILHHQRPGFLSYPSSHTVPYLRTKLFPRAEYPELYTYRDLCSRFEAKVQRALKRIPKLDLNIRRVCTGQDAGSFVPKRQVNAIITSPPYMRSLDYARDNRLRLWFLDSSDWRTLDKSVSPRELEFIPLIRRCLKLWRTLLSPDGHCVIVAGDRFSRIYEATIPDVISKIAIEEVKGYELISKRKEKIPEARRVRRGLTGNQYETILVLRNKGE